MEKKMCPFCQEKAEAIDYKTPRALRRFLNSQGKIYAPKRYGVCTRHQRMLSQAIKRARTMALAPFSIK